MGVGRASPWAPVPGVTPRTHPGWQPVPCCPPGSEIVIRATMTVSYTLKVADSRFGGFSKLLFRWKGSIYKLLYKEFVVFMVLYALLSIVYR